MRWIAPLLSLAFTVCLSPTAARAGERVDSDAFVVAGGAAA